MVLYNVKIHLYTRRFTGLLLCLCRYDEQHIDSTQYGNSYDNNNYYLLTLGLCVIF